VASGLLSRPWQWFFALLPAVGYATFYMLQLVQVGVPWDEWQLTANAQSHAAVLGVFAGFIAAVIAIVLAVGGPSAVEERDAYRIAAVGTYLCAFLHSILGSFQYAAYAGFAKAWVDGRLCRAAESVRVGHTLTISG
jgi:hypothetical protein